MNDIRITATPTQLAGWLQRTAQGQKMSISRSTNPAIVRILREEQSDIERTIRELEAGGIQTEIEKKK